MLKLTHAGIVNMSDMFDAPHVGVRIHSESKRVTISWSIFGLFGEAEKANEMKWKARRDGLQRGIGDLLQGIEPLGD
jgi:hypothetical protein